MVSVSVVTGICWGVGGLVPQEEPHEFGLEPRVAVAD
jgi:hypothetical protein